jgi:multiple sugar transport system substrate-binding protein
MGGFYPSLRRHSVKKFALMALFVALVGIAAGAQSTIKVLLWDDPLAKIIQTNIPDFEKATGYKVEVELVAPPQVLPKTAVGVTSTSSDYDVVPIDEGNIPVFASLMSQYDSLPDGKVFKKTPKDSVTPAMLDVGTWDGKLIAFPINGNLYLWFTRQDLLDNPQYQKDFKAKYGYDLQVPKNFKHLEEMSAFFVSKGLGGFGPFNGGPAGVLAEAVWSWESFGTSFIQWVGGKPKVVLDEAKAVMGMEFYKKLMTLSPKGSETWAHNERIASFCTDPKGVFTQFHWPSYVATYEDPDKSLVAGKIAYSAPPAGPAKRVAVRGAWAVAVPLAAPNKAGAAEFVYWWTSKEISAKVVEGNAIPARSDVLQDAKYAKSKPWLAGIAESMKYAVARPRLKEVPQIQDIVKKYWVMGITGQMPTVDAVRAITKETNDVIAKAGY